MKAKTSVLAAWIVAYCSSTSAFAQEGYWTVGVPGESNEYKLALAESGRPLWYVLDEQTSIRELVMEKCGRQSVVVMSAYLEKASYLNAVEDLDAPIDVGSGVAIPFCHKVDRNVQVPIRAGDTLEEILDRRTGLSGPRTLSAVVRANDKNIIGQPTRADIERFSETLPVNSMLTIPYASQKRMYVPVSHESELARILEANPPVGIRWNHVASAYEPTEDVYTSIENAIAFHMAFTSESSEDSGDSGVDERSLFGTQSTGLRFNNLVSFESVQDAAACATAGAVDHYDFSVLHERVLAEKQKLFAIPRPVTPAVVGIIDSGLATVGEGVFAEHFFKKNEAETLAGSNTGEDDDGLGFADDVWGINFADDTGNIKPFEVVPEKRMAHGTQVASLALGGLSYASLVDPSDVLTQLVIVNFGDPVDGIQYPERLLAAVDYLTGRDSSIINMSLSTSTEIEGLKRRIDRQKRNVLFVVASGNTIPNGIDLKLIPRYPASWGKTSFHQNLVTVGAADSSGARAAFSNHGAIDILAPGCGLKTIDHKNIAGTEFGSSMAAGHVSFVSSLIDGLGGPSMWPGRVKRRLIAGADHVPGLMGGRDILNEVKAVSITHDVVELSGDDPDARQYLFGLLSDVELLRQYCAENDIRLQLSNVQKMTPNIIHGGTTMVRYLVLNGENMGERYCTQTNEDVRIPGFTVDGVPNEDIHLTDVKDVVIATIRL